MRIYLYYGKKNIIGKNVRRLREEAGLTQKQLADEMQKRACDLDRAYIGRIERGQRLVTDFEVKTFVKVFETTFEDIFRDEYGE